MDDGTRVAAIQNLLDGGWPIEPHDTYWLLDRLRAAEAETAGWRNVHLFDLETIRVGKLANDEQAEQIAALADTLAAAEARAAEAEAVIAEAPHDANCPEVPCNCWKFARRSSVLARLKVEAWNAGWEVGWHHDLPIINPYRAGADQ